MPQYDIPRKTENILKKGKSLLATLLATTCIITSPGCGTRGLERKTGENIFSYSARRIAMPAKMGHVGIYDPTMWQNERGEKSSSNIEDYIQEADKFNISVYFEGKGLSQAPEAILFDLKSDNKIIARAYKSTEEEETWEEKNDKYKIIEEIKKLLKNYPELSKNDVRAIAEIIPCTINKEGWQYLPIGYIFTPHQVTIEKFSEYLYGITNVKPIVYSNIGEGGEGAGSGSSSENSSGGTGGGGQSGGDSAGSR